MDSEWVDFGEAAAPSVDGEHLRVLRELLARDYLSRADWSEALRDLALMAREALRAAEGCVALFHAGTGSWLGVSSSGRVLEDEELSRLGVRSTLERVHESGLPVLASVEPLRGAGERPAGPRRSTALAVPLCWWDVKEHPPARRFAGVLYADRDGQEPALGEADVELVLDIVRIAQPTLNVLRYLKQLEAELKTARERLLRLESQDPRPALAAKPAKARASGPVRRRKSEEAVPRRPVPKLAAVKAAIQRHGSASAAAAELGVPAEALLARLRKAGLTVRQLRSR